jgi:carbon-monoxide dehydrogenase large subunit
MGKSSPPMIGRSLPRKEDLRLITGRGTYTADVKLPGMLYATFLRSQYAHAVIKEIDAREALNSPGVVAVLTGKEVSNLTDPFPYLFQFTGLSYPRQFCLAVDKVRFVGEPVAVVLSTSPAAGEDSLELIRVEYEPLPVLLEPMEAVEKSSVTLIHDNIKDNLFAFRKLEKGDIKGAFERAHKVLKSMFKIQRHTGTPIEPHGIVASYDSLDDSLTVYSATQIPTGLQLALSLALRVPQNKIRVIAKDVGGGFGNYKYHPEDIAVCLLSIKFRRPVKWIGKRTEIFLSGYHARDQIHDVEVAVDEDGRILGLKDKFYTAMGAFLPRETIAPPNTTFALLPGPYKIDNISLEMYCVAVNMAPSGAYRGFGQPEANFVLERVLDLVAKELRISPAEVRMRNLLGPGELPRRSPTGIVYDSGNYPLCLERAVELSNYEVVRSRKNKNKNNHRKNKNKNNDDDDLRVDSSFSPSSPSFSSRRTGIGLAFYTEVTGFGPARTTSMNGAIHGGYESATIRVDPSGGVTILTGLMPHGQGSETTLAQVASDLLGVSVDEIKVVYGDTEECPYGHGSFGSRGAVVGSGAVSMACERIIRKGKKIAASLLGAGREDEVEFGGGVFSVKGGASNASAATVSLREVARAAIFGINLPQDIDPGFEATVTFDPTEWTMAYGAHVAVVDVDLETGVVKIPEYYVVHDCGRMLNPMIVEGQVHGGVVQGIGGALLEQIEYDSEGQLLTSSFMDYLVPTSLEVPEFKVEHMETLSSYNPLGVKGVGEGGIIPVSSAIASAVDDALSDLDTQVTITVTETPLTPERVWRLEVAREPSTRSGPIAGAVVLQHGETAPMLKMDAGKGSGSGDVVVVVREGGGGG